MAKKKVKLDIPPQPKVPYNLPEPNDDLAAYGWQMNRLRYPAKDSKPDDIWPGESVFSVPEAKEFRDEYGIDVSFICPHYLQFMLDRSVVVQKATLNCKRKKYSNDSVLELRKAIMQTMRDVVLPDIAQRMKKASVFVAAYYAAKMAYVDTHGASA